MFHSTNVAVLKGTREKNDEICKYFVCVVARFVFSIDFKTVVWQSSSVMLETFPQRGTCAATPQNVLSITIWLQILLKALQR